MKKENKVTEKEKVSVTLGMYCRANLKELLKDFSKKGKYTAAVGAEMDIMHTCCSGLDMHPCNSQILYFFSCVDENQLCFSVQ